MGQSIAKLAINDPKIFINSGIDHAKSKVGKKRYWRFIRRVVFKYLCIR